MPDNSLSPQELTNTLLKAGKALFQTKPTFRLSVNTVQDLPRGTKKEIAFAGRSNVGKSSLINAVTGVKGLARASDTPGRTQSLNFFEADSFFLVDLPGYGYAAAPEKTVQSWTRLIHDYLRGRVQLARVFLLIDIRHGIKKVDLNIMKMLDSAAVSYQLILTKADKVSKKQAEDIFQKTAEIAASHVAAYPEIILTSAESGLGIDETRAQFVKLLKGL